MTFDVGAMAGRQAHRVVDLAGDGPDITTSLGRIADALERIAETFEISTDLDRFGGVEDVDLDALVEAHRKRLAEREARWQAGRVPSTAGPFVTPADADDDADREVGGG